MSSNRNAADPGRTTIEVERLEVTGVHDGHPHDGKLAAARTGQDAAPDGDAAPGDLPRWQDPRLPVARRVEDLVGRLTLEEKVAQLYGVWVGGDSTGEDLAPHQQEMTSEAPDWRSMISAGLGQLTRPFGTAPIDPALGARALARMQQEIVAASRFGIPAIAHEECLTGFMTWKATVYPTPLAWGATFHPELIERMGRQIGSVLRMVGVHQGLAPVIDVIRDLRWGRCEESLGEDPYLVATLGTAYVRGLESTGVVATLKHFVGYSASRAGRNHGPVSIGSRELADVLLPPFEMALRDGGARSVMHAYNDVDGVPPAADPELLTVLLRDRWGFTGTVVADYFGISFLHRLNSVAADLSEAAVLALTAGVDVELPAGHAYGTPLLEAVRAGTVPESLVDRAVTRVLRQKCELGLLDPDWSPVPPVLADGAERSNGEVPGVLEGSVDLDPPANRALAREIAEESVVLLTNSDVLPLRPQSRIAMVGPLADDVAGMLGCYTFPSHVGPQHPELPEGVEVRTLLAALRAEMPETPIKYAPGGTVDGPAELDAEAISTAAAVASEADVCVAVLGDRAGLFGRGTSGEGCDVDDLRLPGAQAELLAALLDTGTPVVLVLLAGRPYALGDTVDRLAAVVQAFFPGEEGGPAVARVLSGAVSPSGRLPVSMPRNPGGQPTSYLSTTLGQKTEVSSVDPTPLFPFGHGLSYTWFSWPEVSVEGAAPDGPVEVPTDGEVSVSVSVRNDGDRAGVEVVQLYLHDPVAQVNRPVVRLIGYARVPLEAGQTRQVDFRVHADLSSFTGRLGYRVVEPGDLELRLSASSDDHRHTVPVRLTGPERRVDHRRQFVAEVTLH
ncbi:glycoside hydrolase family 3 N-terminal domain-containing protein [Micromonospora sp. WMMD1102]|uniref:beta-xylosidase/alpha-l-arabinosidase n=1 Tax=Micromonospora sp. WMMD1102 TaxID=3016105 RepID=UPI00241541C2|nr:glycoside hydrolase family 3 N-terminal domain-containing protein [Micromonospora sp. WMMD1102]MDG4787280.1 glycoside hydrolase family 3 N-terminal domain-containing protein [Micromonospora sp. WMMD1102]